MEKSIIEILFKMPQQWHLQGRQEGKGQSVWSGGVVSYINLIYFIFIHANLLLAKTPKMTLQHRTAFQTNQKPEYNIDITLVQWQFPNFIFKFPPLYAVKQ